MGPGLNPWHPYLTDLHLAPDILCEAGKVIFVAVREDKDIDAPLTVDRDIPVWRCPRWISSSS
jgi:hypothetical protein